MPPRFATIVCRFVGKALVALPEQHLRPPLYYRVGVAPPLITYPVWLDCLPLAFLDLLVYREDEIHGDLLHLSGNFFLFSSKVGHRIDKMKKGDKLHCLSPFAFPVKEAYLKSILFLASRQSAAAPKIAISGVLVCTITSRSAGSR